MRLPMNGCQFTLPISWSKMGDKLAIIGAQAPKLLYTRKRQALSIIKTRKFKVTWPLHINKFGQLIDASFRPIFST